MAKTEICKATMKPSWEWTEDDLVSMKADKTEESLTLELETNLMQKFKDTFGKGKK